METVKYKGVTIKPTPSEPDFPEMVTITRTSKRLKDLLNKKYVNKTKAILAVDTCKANKLIESGRIKTHKELMELGLGNHIRWGTQ